MSTLDIGICTYQRAAVVTTLASIAELVPVEGCALRIIVADNDETPSAQVMVAYAAAKFGLNVTYIHAPAKNISIARNAILAAASADYLAFIDDDEIVGGDWLQAMLHTIRETEAAAVLGPVIAVYAEDSPRWLRKGNFHATYPVHVKRHITTGYCGNVMMTRSAPALANLRFDEALGVSGGEDTDFFARLSKAGGRIVYAREALVYEPVTPERATLKWLMRRRARYGETHAMMLLAQGKPRRPNALKAAIKAAICFAAVLPSALSGVGRAKWLLRGQMHLGAARYLWKAH